MKQLKSNQACLIYIQNLRIVPEVNTFSDEEYEQLSATKEFKQLVKDGKFETMDAVEEVETEDKDVTELSVAELKEYAKTLGLTGVSQYTKPQLLEAISEVTE